MSDEVPSGYFKRSATPLTSLAFVLPLVVLYEIGTRWFTFDAATLTEQRIVAFNLVQGLLANFGATAQYLPAALVVVALLGVHVAHRDKWQLRLGDVPMMAAESLMLALPLLAAGIIMSRAAPMIGFMPMIGTPSPMWAVPGELPGLLVLSVGAGVYEELVFRLLGFALLHAVLADFLAVPAKTAGAITIAVSAVLFAAYHHLGPEPFHAGTFAFRTLGGVWFGWVFANRGFGLAVGTHAVYDIAVVTLWAVGA